MEWLKNNVFDVVLIIGITFISIGFFIYSIILGFIGTGVILSAIALKGGDR